MMTEGSRVAEVAAVADGTVIDVATVGPGATALAGFEALGVLA
jgi:hypothetical protein